MKIRFFYMILSITLLLSACSQFSSSQGNLDHRTTFDGVLLIESAGKSVWLGTDEEDAPSIERPRMKVEFSYDFEIGDHEVTNGEFEKLMGYRPVGRSDGYPAANVNWYEAVKYCNELSKSYGLDTTYSYVEEHLDTDKRVVNLIGLQTDFSSLGFRLPTEAEWMFAAAEGKSTTFPWGDSDKESVINKFSWNSSNTSDRSQPVKSKAPIGGLYDMAGNVSEWVNDMVAPFIDTTLIDFIGADFEDPQNTRVVKGGAYLYSADHLRISRRTDVYGSNATTRAAHIGFRVARGVITGGPSTHRGLENGTPVYRSASDSEIKSFLSEKIQSRATLAFVNKSTGNLVSVDFWDPSGMVIEYWDTLKVANPVISPNGKWIVFSNAAEGQIFNSHIYSRIKGQAAAKPYKLDGGSNPRFFLDPSDGTQYLTYTTSAASNGDSAAWAGGLTKVAKFKGDEIEIIDVFKGGFNGGRSPSGKYWSSGYTKLRVMENTSKEVEQHFTAAMNGKAEGESDQVCNISFAPDASDRLAFIDFGAVEKSSLVGREYGVHEFLFVENAADGNIIEQHKVPEGYKGWAEPEWSNHPHYLVSSLTDAKEVNGTIHLYNMNSGSSIQLAEGDHVAYPAFWVDSTADDGLAWDSLGWYNSPRGTYRRAEFAFKLQNFWTQGIDSEVLFLGSSRASYGIDPEVFQYATFNMGYPLGLLREASRLIDDYVVPHADRARVVVLTLDFDLFNHKDDYWGELTETRGYQYDKSHDFFVGRTDSALSEARSRITVTGLDELSKLGFTKKREPSGWGDVEVYNEDDWSITSPAVQANLTELEFMIQKLAEQDIQLAGVVVPIHPGYKESGFFGLYGCPDKTAEALDEHMKSLAEKYEHFHYFDANKFGDHGYGDEDAHNMDHLSVEGAEKFSTELKEFLVPLLQGRR